MKKFRRFLVVIAAMVMLMVGTFTVSSTTTQVQAKSDKIVIGVAYGQAKTINRLKAKMGSYAVIKTITETSNINNYDGLILPGGRDIDPVNYGQGMNGARNCNQGLDRKQKAVLKKFVKAEKPVLGICRGNQLINVYFGGTLKQDIKSHKNTTHTVKTVSGTLVRNTHGTSKKVNSYHHQCADKIGKGLKATAYATVNGKKTVEGVEHETLPI